MDSLVEEALASVVCPATVSVPLDVREEVAVRVPKVADPVVIALVMRLAIVVVAKVEVPVTESVDDRVAEVSEASPERDKVVAESVASEVAPLTYRLFAMDSLVVDEFVKYVCPDTERAVVEAVANVLCPVVMTLLR